MPNKAVASSREVAPYIAELAHTEIAALLVEHTGSLRNFARSIASSRDQADDLVQEASLRALAAAARFTPGTNFRAWIFTILRNLRYNEYRKPWLRHQPLHELL
ncbi:MAG: sigma-70 family RNA polymerase sigma factor, partial [Rhodospirillaceae bacterium]|nr:sigma-70 family RNA polymerase sigma factor [Rhodospirillaceae bacterium]